MSTVTGTAYRHRLRTRDQITHKIVRELLDYDPETGILTWKYRDRKWFSRERDWKKWNRQFAGKQAFTSTGPRLYARGTLLRRTVIAHRIIFLWMTGRYPDPDTDHINRDKSDNRWSNLREATRSLNVKNRGLRYDNKSGVKGVYSRKYAYVALISNKYLGSFKTLEAAAVARQQAERECGHYDTDR